MPEGDTLHRTANRLRPALAGEPLVRIELARVPRPHPSVGTEVLDVRAVGKHLLVDLDGWLLRTHLRMTGSWHLYETGQRWRRPAHLARVVLGVPRWEAVCFSAPVVALERTSPTSPGGAVARPGVPDALAHLGPDLCVEGADLDAAVERMATVPAPDTTIAEALLDQRIAAGIGNVYKSEVLWACRVDPFAPVASVEVATRRRLVERAHRLLLANLDGGARTTVPGAPGSLAVYGRRGRPCRRCGTPVRSRRHGEQARSTYWCPRCQRDG